MDITDKDINKFNIFISFFVFWIP